MRESSFLSDNIGFVLRTFKLTVKQLDFLLEIPACSDKLSVSASGLTS